MALLGKDAAGPFDDLERLVEGLLRADRERAELLQAATGARPDCREELIPEIGKVSASLMGSARGDDAVATTIDTIVAQVEGICKKYIR